MTDPKPMKGHKLAREILGLLAVTVAVTLFLFLTLGMIAHAMIDRYLFASDILLTEAQYGQVDGWVFQLSLIVSAVFFVLLFLFLLGERLSYIRDILIGIDALRSGVEDHAVPLEGRNELTQLAEAVNYLSRTQREMKEKARALQEEKEQFLRALSHDIRTPLTSIMAYSELLAGGRSMEPAEQKRYMELIGHKAGQIKDMTDLLLDGRGRSPEYFEDARLLMEQLICEFEEVLEEDFTVETRLDAVAFSGTFDVQALRRIFDNLSSNVQKYADPAHVVRLSISWEHDRLVIRQSNAIRTPDKPAEGYRIGLRSIERIAQSYSGQVDVKQGSGVFSITITLLEF